MSERIEALPWDSEFFGVSIGKVDLDGADRADLAVIVAEARDRGFDCVYGQHTPEGTEVSLHAQEAGFRLVEVNQTMHRRAGPFPTPTTDSTVREATVDDIADLDRYLHLLAPWSRFGADPRFGQEAAARMFRAWVTRAAEDPRRMLTISEDADGINGVGTHVRDEIPRIDLLGVIKNGSRASWMHLAKLVEWAGGSEVEAGPCAARNIAVLRFLEHNGFMISKVTYTHHWWAEGKGVVDG